jgi:hypothetical protein
MRLLQVTDYCPGGELFFHLKKLRRFTEGIVTDNTPGAVIGAVSIDTIIST